MTLKSQTCRSDYNTDTGRTAAPGDRIIRCNLLAGHDGDHDELIDGQRGVVSWGRIPHVEEPPAIAKLNPSAEANDRPQETDAPTERRNVHCSNCGNTRGGPFGHETSECTWHATESGHVDNHVTPDAGWLDAAIEAARAARHEHATCTYGGESGHGWLCSCDESGTGPDASAMDHFMAVAVRAAAPHIRRAVLVEVAEAWEVSDVRGVADDVTAWLRERAERELKPPTPPEPEPGAYLINDVLFVRFPGDSSGPRWVAGNMWQDWTGTWDEFGGPDVTITPLVPAPPEVALPWHDGSFEVKDRNSLDGESHLCSVMLVHEGISGPRKMVMTESRAEAMGHALLSAARAARQQKRGRP